MIDIIIPAYRGLEELKKCLDSVIHNQQRNPFNIIVIDDASPEKKLSEYLDHISTENKKITLIRNKTNLGFVASVNKGMALHTDRDVVLLNSDAIVSNNWLDRMHRCAYLRKETGTVTPFSNNATICSFPNICEVNPLPSGWSLEDIDRIFAEINEEEYIDIPTAVGFCMYIKRSCINDIGLFDVKSFSKGYGEENDFCMRAAMHGWKHVLCADTFVYHKGACSFGLENEPRLACAMEKLDRLYKEYHRTVHSHITDNPAQPFRLAVMLELVSRSKKHKVLFVNHNMGGGAEKFIQDLAAFLKEEMDALVVRPGKNGRIYFNILPNMNTAGFEFILPYEYQAVLKLCKHLGVSRVHFHHTMGLETSLWGLARDLSVPLDITLHDYYFINANPTLTTANGFFCDEMGARDSLCKERYPIPGGVSSNQWRHNQKILLMTAERVFAPSKYTAELFKSYYPNLEPIVAFHTDWEIDAPYPAPNLRRITGNEPLRIVIIGALSKEKGADILESCAKTARNFRYPLEFHLIGYAYRPLDTAVNYHGPYNDDELDTLISNIAPHVIWFPALWPETYSYTLSAALRSASPVVAPETGAFPERLKGRPFTWVETFYRTGDEWAEYFLNLRGILTDATRENRYIAWDNQPVIEDDTFLYSRDYLEKTTAHTQNTDDRADNAWIKQLINRIVLNKAGKIKLNRKEKFLIFLLKIRKYRIISAILYLIPHTVQRAIKRYLSTRPIHEYLLYK